MSLHELFFHTASALNFVGADSFLGRRHRGVGCVFVLHSVVYDRQDYLNDPLRTSAAFLDTVIAHYLSEGVDIVSLDTAIERLKIPSPPPFVCFTFDDGYKDNKTVALPIFERYSVPFAVFVTTCLINRTVNHWWMGLMDLINRHDSIVVEALDREFIVSEFKNKVTVYQYLCAQGSSGALSQNQLKDLFGKYEISVENILDADALTEGEVQQLSKHPLVEIGAHTENHLHLKQLGDVEARREMLDNKVWLENITGREINHFAYPYGGCESCGEREFAIARDIGFQTGMTTRIGNLMPEHVLQPTALPRLRMFNQHESIRLLEFQRCGAASALVQGFGSAGVIS